MEANENIDLRKLINILFSRKLFIIFIVMVSIVLGYFYSYYYKMPKYSSSVTLLLVGDENKEQKEVTQIDLLLNSGLISTYSNIAKSDNVVRQTIDNLQLDISVEDLQKNVTVEEVKGTQFIKIIVVNSDPEIARNIASQLSSVFCSQINEIYNLQNINIIDEAEISYEPCNVNHIKDMAIAVFIGIVTSISLILIIYFLDDTIKDAKEIERILRINNIGTLPIIEKQDKGLIIETDPKAHAVECLKTIRTNILYTANMTKKKAILITSAKRKEGKSWIINNIAIAFAQANKKVLLLDTNLRKESNKDEIFNAESKEGLADFIKEISEDNLENLEKSRKYIKETKIPNLHLLTNGTIPPNPSELISSNRMRKVLELLRYMYDIILLDGSSCLLLSDSVALSSMVDSTVIVAESKKTRLNEIRKVKRLIEDVNGNIMGTILNKHRAKGGKHYGKGYGYYYGKETVDDTKKFEKQRIITLDEIIELAKKNIEEEIIRENEEKEFKKLSKINAEEIVDKENKKILNTIKKLFDKILKVEKGVKNRQQTEDQSRDFIIDEINKLKIGQEKIVNTIENDRNMLQGKIDSLVVDKDNILEEIKILKRSNSDIIEETAKLKESNNNILEQMNNIKVNIINIFKNIETLNEYKDVTSQIINSLEQKLEDAKINQMQSDDYIRVIIEKIHKLKTLNSRTEQIEKRLDMYKELNQKVKNTETELKRLKRRQSAKIKNMDIQLRELQEIQTINNIELLDKIEEMNYDEELYELNEKILQNREEYTRMFYGLKQNKQEKIVDNIVSFESLRQKKQEQTLKKSFNIKENIMYEDLEILSTCIIDLTNDSSKTDAI